MVFPNMNVLQPLKVLDDSLEKEKELQRVTSRSLSGCIRGMMRTYQENLDQQQQCTKLILALTPEQLCAQVDEGAISKATSFTASAPEEVPLGLIPPQDLLNPGQVADLSQFWELGKAMKGDGAHAVWAKKSQDMIKESAREFNRLEGVLRNSTFDSKGLNHESMFQLLQMFNALNEQEKIYKSLADAQNKVCTSIMNQYNTLQPLHIDILDAHAEQQGMDHYLEALLATITAGSLVGFKCEAKPHLLDPEPLIGNIPTKQWKRNFFYRIRQDVGDSVYWDVMYHDSDTTLNHLLCLTNTLATVIDELKTKFISNNAADQQYNMLATEVHTIHKRIIKELDSLIVKKQNVLDLCHRELNRIEGSPVDMDDGYDSATLEARYRLFLRRNDAQMAENSAQHEECWKVLQDVENKIKKLGLDRLELAKERTAMTELYLDQQQSIGLKSNEEMNYSEKLKLTVDDCQVSLQYIQQLKDLANDMHSNLDQRTTDLLSHVTSYRQGILEEWHSVYETMVKLYSNFTSQVAKGKVHCIRWIDQSIKGDLDSYHTARRETIKGDEIPDPVAYTNILVAREVRLDLLEQLKFIKEEVMNIHYSKPPEDPTAVETRATSKNIREQKAQLEALMEEMRIEIDTLSENHSLSDIKDMMDPSVPLASTKAADRESKVKKSVNPDGRPFSKYYEDLDKQMMVGEDDQNPIRDIVTMKMTPKSPPSGASTMSMTNPRSGQTTMGLLVSTPLSQKPTSRGVRHISIAADGQEFTSQSQTPSLSRGQSSAASHDSLYSRDSIYKSLPEDRISDGVKGGRRSYF